MLGVDIGVFLAPAATSRLDAERQLHAEPERGTYYFVVLALGQYVRPQGNRAARYAKSASDRRLTAEDLNGLFLGHGHALHPVSSELDTVYVKHPRLASV